MTMCYVSGMPDRLINATDFKAKCLAILDDVDANGSTVTVTKRGRAVAVIGPARAKTWKSLKGILAGEVLIPDDLLNKDRGKLWDCAQAGGAR